MGLIGGAVSAPDPAPYRRSLSLSGGGPPAPSSCIGRRFRCLALGSGL